MVHFQVTHLKPLSFVDLQPLNRATYAQICEKIHFKVMIQLQIVRFTSIV